MSWQNHSFGISKAYVLIKHSSFSTDLLIIAKEHLNGEPSVTADLEAVLKVVKLADLIGGQLPAIDIKVALNARLADGLGNDTPALLDTPNEEHLLRSLALLLRNLEEGGVLVQGGVGGTQTGVTSGVDALGGVVGDQLGGGVVGVQLDLVDGGHDLAAGVIQELLQVLDTEVGDTDVADLASGRQLLHFLPVVNMGSQQWFSTELDVKCHLPGLDEVPVGQVLRQVIGVGGAGPVNQVEVDVIGAEVLERGIDSLSHALVPGVVQLGGEPDLLAGHAGVLDTGTNLGLVAISQSSINVAVTGEKGVSHGNADLIGLGLPCSQTDGGDLGTGVEGVGLPADGDWLMRWSGSVLYC